MSDKDKPKPETPSDPKRGETSTQDVEPPPPPPTEPPSGGDLEGGR